MDNTTDRKALILAALDRFTRQRAGLEFGNYGSVKAYRAEQRQITRDLRDYRALAAQVAWRGIDADALLAASRDAYSGRLSCTIDGDHARLDYCTGQYFPTEYRKAACAVLASALWHYVREHCMPAPVHMHNSETGEDVTRYQDLRAGDWLRRYFHKEFGRSIASRYFN